MMGRFSFGLLALVMVSASWADTITLQDAINLAKKNNGTLKAAQADILAAKARTRQSRSAFMPTLTPSLNYSKSVREIADSQFGNSTLDFEQTSTRALLAWTVLDAGQRLTSLRGARASESAQVATSRQSMRIILNNVQEQYLETLRSQELEKVAKTQLERSEKVLEQTKTRVDVGDAAKREILQAQADTLNATVNAITAKNRINTNTANLKAVVGADLKAEDLEKVTYSPAQDLPNTLEEALNMGMQIRPDLISRRSSIAAQGYNVRSSEIDGGLTYAFDLSYNQQFSPSSSGNQQYSFFISYPLYDGGLRQAVIDQGRAQLTSIKAQLLQAERDAKADIESAFLTNQQNSKRLEAADAALRAARLNFESVTESRRLGVSNLIDVLTAQVSLVTAESNYIEAVYDALISQFRLRLATGLPLPGEEI